MNNLQKCGWLVLIVLVLIPAVTADSFPRQASFGDTVTVVSTLSNSNVVYWDEESYVWPTLYFYPDMDDVPAIDGGTWRHDSTYVMNVTWMVTYNRYLNFSDSMIHQFTIDYLEVRVFEDKQTRLNVAEGESEFFSLNESISGSPAVIFQFVNNPDNVSLPDTMFITKICVNMTFLTTYHYWNWVCGGVSHGLTPLEQLVIPVIILVVLVVLGVFCIPFGKKEVEGQ